jgi:hypothetical protein
LRNWEKSPTQITVTVVETHTRDGRESYDGKRFELSLSAGKSASVKAISMDKEQVK